MRKCYRPTGGWAMRARNVSIVQDKSGQASGPGRPVMRCLGHMRSSVSCLMALDKRYCTGKQKGKAKKIVNIEQTTRYRNITPALMRVLPRTQALLSTLSSKRVLPSSIAEGDGGIAWRGWTGRGGSMGGTYIGSACGTSPARVSAWVAGHP